MPGARRDAFNYVYDADTDAWRPQPYSTPSAGTTTATGSTTSILSYSFDSAASLWKPTPFSAAAAAGGGDTNVKTIVTPLIAITTVSAQTRSISSELDTTNYQRLMVFLDHAPLTTSVPVAGTEYTIEGSAKLTGNADWRALATFRSGVLAAVAATVTDTMPGGTNIIPFAATPAYTSTDRIFFQNIVLANSEWAEVYHVTTDASLELVDNLTNTQASSVIYNRCEEFVATINVAELKRVRCVCNNGLHVNSYLLAWQVQAMAGTF
jgi:hypothetical protein